MPVTPFFSPARTILLPLLASLPYMPAGASQKNLALKTCGIFMFASHVLVGCQGSDVTPAPNTPATGGPTAGLSDPSLPRRPFLDGLTLDENSRTLKWSAKSSLDKDPSSIIQFEIARRRNKASQFEIIEYVDPDITTFVLENIQPGDTFYVTPVKKNGDFGTGGSVSVENSKGTFTTNFI